jgi:hypothetical protein
MNDRKGGVQEKWMVSTTSVTASVGRPGADEPKTRRNAVGICGVQAHRLVEAGGCARRLCFTRLPWSFSALLRIYFVLELGLWYVI